MPSFTGLRALKQVPLETLVPFIDWTFFFSAWELKGRYPGIFEHPKYGAAAKELYDHAQELLGEIEKGKLLTANGAYGFWPANSDGDDLVIYTPDTTKPGGPELMRFPMLRQQEVIADDKPNRSLADFVAPKESGRLDYVGAFAATAGIGVEPLVAHYQRDHDDYRAIMVKALADRLAEAFAESLHAQARHEWGYEQGELTAEDLAAEKIPRHPAGVRLPGLPGSLREVQAVRSAGGERGGHRPHRIGRHAAGRQRQRPLLRPPDGPLLHGRPPRRRPGQGLRLAQGDEGGRGGAVARVESGVRDEDGDACVGYGL